MRLRQSKHQACCAALHWPNSRRTPLLVVPGTVANRTSMASSMSATAFATSVGSSGMVMASSFAATAKQSQGHSLETAWAGPVALRCEWCWCCVDHWTVWNSSVLVKYRRHRQIAAQPYPLFSGRSVGYDLFRRNSRLQRGCTEANICICRHRGKSATHVLKQVPFNQNAR